MTDAVLIDLAVKVDPAIEVVFIDTGYHFPETLATVEEVRRHYGLNLRMMTVARQQEELWAGRPGELLLGRQGRPARPGPRRQGRLDERPAPRRGRQPRVGARSSPATSGAWSRSTRSPPGPTSTCSRYIDQHDIIVNPLTKQGYPSIGCMPCTTPVADGEDPRAGRWRGPGQDGVRAALA